MPAVIQTSFSTILLAMKAQLVSKLPLPTNSVKICRKKTIPKFQGGPDVLLIPSAPKPLPEWVEGAGRVASVAYRSVLAVPRLRLQMDASDEDQQWLTHVTKGLLAFEDKIIDALQVWDGMDSSGNMLTVMPIRLEAGDTPADEGPDPGWGQMPLSFSVFYELLLDQTRQ